MMNFLSKIELPDKRYRYIFHASVVMAYIYLVSFGLIKFSPEYLLLISLVLVILGTLFCQFPIIDFKNFPFSLIMPFSLLMGALMFLINFPNLGTPFKYVAIAGFGFFYYLIFLVDNIFLVIQDREEVIPLYRAATAWSQILQVMVAMPLFSGIFKLNVVGFVQSLMVGLVSFVFVLYQIWSSRFDKDAKKLRVGELLFLSGLAFFLTSTITMAVSFIAVEAFLKALLIAVILMFGLSYVASHLRNDITKQMIMQFAFIFLFFIIILILFTP